ncbi:chaperone for protein-folding within the ER, fungal-domain-containing protein [Butyriboletus roseoflavus]|nr:chaperone for protein-folding within the ER, fungal-domain-containing protein [Butyriboletus roseoflavus]
MIVFPLLSLFLATHALGQAIVYDLAHNVTVLYGTWSSGSQNVITGPSFAQPANESFTYPPTTGMSYSFTSDGYYEIARYRMTGNGDRPFSFLAWTVYSLRPLAPGTQPNCITGVMNWCHGTYDLVSNGSIVLHPFGDGYQQIQDPCAPVSNFIENYNDTELYVMWMIYQDAVRGYTLQLYQFDGTPLPPLWLVSTQPNMLPTQALRNVTSTGQTAAVLLANAGERSWGVSRLTGVFSLVAALGIASVLL